jgi:hypothetical protein
VNLLKPEDLPAPLAAALRVFLTLDKRYTFERNAVALTGKDPGRNKAVAIAYAERAGAAQTLDAMSRAYAPDQKFPNAWGLLTLARDEWKWTQ